MKKFLCVFMVLMLALPTFAFAKQESADKMQEVLIIVKNKVEVPAELTEFKPYANEYEDGTTYIFTWTNEEKSANMEITADEKGRVRNYYSYDYNFKSDKLINKLSKADIIAFAEDFAKKALPEAYEGESNLEFVENSWHVSGSDYRLDFARTYNGINVKGNSVSFRIQVADDVAYVRSMSASINYDAVFEPEGEVIENYEEKYREAFPEEMIYEDAYGEDKKDSTVLLYRFKDAKTGYILASTGEVVNEDLYEGVEEVFDSANKNMAATGGAMRDDVLTEKELEELGEIENLMGADDAFKALSKLPYVKINSSMKRESYNISQRNDEYTVSVSYATEKDDYWLSATFDGESRELSYLYAGVSRPYRAESVISDSTKRTANKNAEAFLKAAAGSKLGEYRQIGTNTYNDRVTYNYNRVVNGVRYTSDSMYVGYDTKDDIIVNYSIDYETKRSFAEPIDVIDADKAYERLMELSKLKKIYLKTGGSYKVCFTVSNYDVEIDAFSGEEYNPYGAYQIKQYEYTDIENHWAGEKIAKLAEVQIGLAGDTFRPDDAIKQIDALRLLAAGTRGRYYVDYSEEDIYREFIDGGILTEEEKNPEKLVTREEAFVYMIRLADLDDVAKLSDIFKVEYEDGHLLSEGNIGYPAILTGMGVVCGNGGKLRPQDTATRAETAVMVYNYLTK